MRSAAYWLSPAKLYWIQQLHDLDSLSAQCNHSLCLQLGVKKQGQAEVVAQIKAAVLAWSCETAGANYRSYRIQESPGTRGKNSQGSPSSKIPTFPYLSFQEGMLASKLSECVETATL